MALRLALAALGGSRVVLSLNSVAFAGVISLRAAPLSSMNRAGAPLTLASRSGESPVMVTGNSAYLLSVQLA